MRTAIALNRFGLGAKPTDSPPSDPRGWLLGQFDDFESRPRIIAETIQPSRVFENYDEIREARRNRDPEGGDPMMAGQETDRPRRARGAGVAGDDEAMRGSRRHAPRTDDAGASAGQSREERREARRAARAGDADPAMDADRERPRHRRRGEAESDQPAMGGGSSRELLGLPGALVRSTTQARFETAIATPTPFVERLVHFWSNHFAVSDTNIIMRSLVGSFEFDAIRPNVLGKFADLAAAAENHPAMLVYLDQYVSVGPNSRRGGPGRQTDGEAPPQRGLNENLAREILELHTLGVRSGYTEEDVRELARGMTGRAVSGQGSGRRSDGPAGTAVFIETIHEPGARTLLGRSFPDTGERQAAAMIDFVARRPETARHIATKLARHFIADDPPPAAVARLERAFISSDGDLPTVYRALVEAPESWQQPFAKFKTPWDWLVSSWRAVGPEVEIGRTREILEELGQPMWKPASPAGFGDLSSDWAGPDALMRRVEMAQELVRRMPEPAQPLALGEAVLPEVLGAESRAAISRADSTAQGLAMTLVTPEFLRR